jgi:hypothetical protein
MDAKNADSTRATQPLSDCAIHLSAGIIGEPGPLLSMTRALLAPPKAVLRIIDMRDLLATLAAVG